MNCLVENTSTNQTTNQPDLYILLIGGCLLLFVMYESVALARPVLPPLHSNNNNEPTPHTQKKIRCSKKKVAVDIIFYKKMDMILAPFFIFKPKKRKLSKFWFFFG